ncbi:MFS transporter, PPP family, 3-phenylpropionic acid transporter [Rhizobium sp. RU35A]|uniref:MFS transporter n=1 Tax=Rhizobium sp. RU35A TaxID=1907414 RepID=UPI000953E044|nr:MFS transporter [Rhizobium sp. RU35A]SIR01557.1 MFS transporter, PPP family, 3-phenylpropionic acid transporter [Rhizobium sp. RU35A]
MAQVSVSTPPIPSLFAARCAFAYAVALGVNGVLLPYFPVWLRSLALNDVEIGLILSLPIVLRVMSAPLAGLLADRLSERARILLISAILSIATAIGLMVVNGFWLVLVIFGLQGAAFAPFTPVLESITVMGVRRWGLRYGTIRVWGSIGFVAVTLLAGQAMAHFSVSVVPLAALLAFSLTLMAALTVPRLGRAAARPASAAARGSARALPPGLHLLMIGCTVVQCTHGMYYAFSAIHWESIGFSGSEIGLLWSAGVMAEILFFFLSGQIARRVTPIRLIVFGSLVAILRWVLFVQPLGIVPALLLQCCHAFSFAFLHFGLQQKIVESVHESQESTVQGTYFFYSGAFLAGSTFLSGVIYRHFGQEGYYAMALTAACGLVLVLLAARKVVDAPATAR